MTEDEPKRGRRPVMTVLAYGDIRIKKDANCFRVTGGKAREKYYRTLPDALFEMRNRLLDNRLHERHDKGLVEISSLITLLREQHRETMRILNDIKTCKGGRKDDTATCDG